MEKRTHDVGYSSTSLPPRKSESSATPNLITKYSMKGTPSVPSSSVSTLGNETWSMETILNVVNPEFIDSEYNLPIRIVIDDRELFLQASFRDILSTATDGEGEALIRDFVSYFPDDNDKDKLEINKLLEEFRSTPQRWCEYEYNKVKGAESDSPEQLADDVTANAIADLIQESLDDPATKHEAEYELSNIRTKLKKMYYFKSCIMCCLVPKPILKNEIEANDSEVIKVKGKPFEKVTDHDLLSIIIAVKCGLKVKELVLKNCNITDLGVWHLTTTIKNFQWPLTILDLGDNDINEKGASLLAEIIKANCTLKSINLQGNKIKDYGNYCIVKALTTNFHLNSLDVSNTDAEMKSVVALFVVLSSHRSIKCLKVGRPLIQSQQEEPLHHLAKVFQVNKILKEIHIPKFNITDRGIFLLVNGLMHNRTLTCLDLGCNKIIWDGAATLAKYLDTNPPLQILNLHANRIENPGAESIARALTHNNTTLKKLIVSNNRISTSGLRALARSLTFNKTLTHLYVWGNIMETKACIALTLLLKSSRLMQEAVDFIPYTSVDGVVNLASANVTTNDLLTE